MLLCRPRTPHSTHRRSQVLWVHRRNENAKAIAEHAFGRNWKDFIFLFWNTMPLLPRSNRKSIFRKSAMLISHRALNANKEKWLCKLRMMKLTKLKPKHMISHRRKSLKSQSEWAVGLVWVDNFHVAECWCDAFITLFINNHKKFENRLRFIYYFMCAQCIRILSFLYPRLLSWMSDERVPVGWPRLNGDAQRCAKNVPTLCV